MKQTLLANGLPKETVVAIIMLNEKIKAMVCSLDGDTNFFDIVAGLLQQDTWALYLFILCPEYVL